MGQRGGGGGGSGGGGGGGGGSGAGEGMAMAANDFERVLRMPRLVESKIFA